jgi:hypothetical protein
MDEDLAAKTKDELVAEVRLLRAAIRAHRDGSGHELCWYHPQLWGLLPEKLEAKIRVPEWPAFLDGCIRYRRSLDEQNPDAPRTSAAFDAEKP